MKDFYNCNNWELAQDEEIENFVTYLYREKCQTVNTIRSTLSAIAFHLKGRKKQDFTKNFVIEKLLHKYAKLSKSSRTRDPIQKPLLNRLLQFVSCNYTDDYNKHAYFVLYALMYKMALRISEIIDYRPNKFSHAILKENFQLKRNKSVQITLASFKHSKEPAVYLLRCNNTLWRHIQKFLALRGEGGPPLYRP